MTDPDETDHASTFHPRAKSYTPFTSLGHSIQGMPFFGGTAPWTPLPVPIAPVPPNFHVCDPFYGDRLALSPCILAAGRLPRGSTFITYDQDHTPYSLPTTSQYGSCQVRAAYAFPDGNEIVDGRIAWPPDVLRNAASWIISQCVMPNSWGGFATISLESMMDWITNGTTTYAEINNGPWPVNSVFITVTVSEIDHDNEKNRMRDRNPGYVDPSVAEALSDALGHAGNMAGATQLSAWAGRMSRGSSFAWWSAFTKQTPAQREDRMTYVCDAQLGSPVSADCSQLGYSKLGPLSDSLTVGPGYAVKILTYKTCKAAITASSDIVLTWSQIKVALASLINECVKHPLRPPLGGRAHAANQLPGKFIGRGTERKEYFTAGAGGMNALPPHVDITLSRQN